MINDGNLINTTNYICMLSVRISDFIFSYKKSYTSVDRAHNKLMVIFLFYFLFHVWKMLASTTTLKQYFLFQDTHNVTCATTLNVSKIIVFRIYNDFTDISASVFLYYKCSTLSACKFKIFVQNHLEVWLKTTGTGTYLFIIFTNCCGNCSCLKKIL